VSREEFFAIVGRLTRDQGWRLDTVGQAAIEFIAANQTRRAQFVRTLRRIQREENQVSDSDV
jgi:hypothetical protein